MPKIEFPTITYDDFEKAPRRMIDKINDVFRQLDWLLNRGHLDNENMKTEVIKVITPLDNPYVPRYPDIEKEIEDIKKQPVDPFGINPEYLKFYPNKCYNSSFEVFDANMKPLYWETDNGYCTADSNFDNTYSLCLPPGAYVQQVEISGNGLVDPAWWSWCPDTRYSFRIKGSAPKRVIDGCSGSATGTIKARKILLQNILGTNAIGGFMKLVKERVTVGFGRVVEGGQVYSVATLDVLGNPQITLRKVPGIWGPGDAGYCCGWSAYYAGAVLEITLDPANSLVLVKYGSQTLTASVPSGTTAMDYWANGAKADYYAIEGEEAVKGGMVRIEVIQGGQAVPLWAWIPSPDGQMTKSEPSPYLVTSASPDWPTSLRTFCATPNPSGGRMALKITNIGQTNVYIDAVTLEPDFTGRWPSFYTHGPCSVPSGT